MRGPSSHLTWNDPVYICLVLFCIKMHFFKLSKLFEQTLVNQRNTVTDAGSDPDRGKYEIKQDYFVCF